MQHAEDSPLLPEQEVHAETVWQLRSCSQYLIMAESWVMGLR